jgi:signal transduction histidine kinase
MPGRVGSVAARLRRGVTRSDVALAGVVALVCLWLGPRGPTAARLGVDATELPSRPWTSTALVAVACLALVWRRAQPVAVLLVVMASTVADTAVTGWESRCIPALLVAVYSVAVQTNRRTAALAAAMSAGFLLLPTFVATDRLLSRDAAYALASFCALAAAIGDSVRHQRAAVSAAEARAAAAEATREEEARRRVVEERLRIARELHDAVAHHVSVVNVQAGVASHLLEADPAAARAALGHVRTAGRQVIEEMRAMVGLLRTDDQVHVVEPPTPGLGQIADLLGWARAAGLAVELDDQVGAREVPVAVGLTAYRVVQESLTNAARHGTGTARVTLRGDADALHVEVANPVAGPRGAAVPTPAAGGGTGHGLVGMRERVHAVGGTLAVDAGATFVVRADLPWEGTRR